MTAIIYEGEVVQCVAPQNPSARLPYRHAYIDTRQAKATCYKLLCTMAAT